MNEDLKKYHVGLDNCQTAIDVVSNVPLKLSSDGKIIHCFNWLKEVEHNLKAAIDKAEVDASPSNVDPA